MNNYELELNKRIEHNIYGENNELLIGVGNIITDSILKRLNNRNWYIEEPKKMLLDNIALLDDEMQPILISGDINMMQIISKAKQIVNIVKNNPVICKKMKKLNEFDEYTYKHSNQVAYLSTAIGIKLNLQEDELIKLSISALLHDIGKCSIQKDILNKSSKLSFSEIEIMKKHPFLGYEILKKYPELDKNVLSGVLFHHENYDGTGYPFGISKDQIPLSARIIRICDVFDALTSKRVYKDKITEEESMEIIKKDSNIFYDPNLVDLFSNYIQVYKIGSTITLENGEKAIIKGFKRDSNGNVNSLQLEFESKTKVYTNKMLKK